MLILSRSSWNILFCIVLILTIAVVFDFAEKIDNFMEKQAPVKAIIFDYYMNFIPYFAMLFAPLLYLLPLFSLLQNGSKYRDYCYSEQRNEFQENDVALFSSAFIIATFTFVLTNFVIPKSNLIRRI